MEFNVTKRRVLEECQSHGVSPESTEHEIIWKNGRLSAYVIRCFFHGQLVTEIAESIINALTGFGKLIKRFNNDEAEDVLEVSFKF